MKKKSFTIILLITSISLLGLISMQLFWMKSAFDLRREQFDNKVKIALKSTVNQLIEYNRDRKDTTPNYCHSFCHLSDQNINHTISLPLLDSLLKNEFNYYKISIYYEYGIYNCDRNKLIMGKCQKYAKQIFETHHEASLTCLWQKDCYLIGVYFPEENQELISQMGIWFISSLIFMIIVIASFAITIWSTIKQKKISEMKNDFVNNMTHEFKTPISTISVTSEMLMNPNITSDSTKVSKYAAIIFEENNRLKKQVEKVLQAAILERDKYHLSLTEIDTHQLLSEIINNCSVHLSDCNVQISIMANAVNPIVYADRVHLTNIFSNLIDNAIKYSREQPEITIKTENINNNLIIHFIDKGIGIHQKDINSIFTKFYRVSTGNVHNVKGFGIGLYYVKKMIEAHKGTIKVSSEIGKGSTFSICIPSI